MIDKTDIGKIVGDFSKNTLSLYLRVDPSYIENQAQTPAWNIWLKNALRKVEASVDESQNEIWKHIQKQVDNYLDNYKPSGKTLVLFIDEDHEYIQELPFTMENHSHFGKPMVSPLLWAIDEYEQYLIVLVDQQRAIFRKAYLGNMETESEMTIDLEYDWGEKTLMPASDGDGQALRQGTNRDAFDNMIDAHVDRFHQDIADEVQTIFKKNQPIRLILAGDEKSAHILQNKLHPSVSEQLVSILPIPMDANDKDIMKRMWQTAYNYERNFEFDLINNITSMAHANGRGALGRDDLKTAMEMQQVELIVMPYSLLQDDADYAQDITLWAIENNKQIEFVHGQAARKLENAGGIAARLYYSLETA